MSKLYVCKFERICRSICCPRSSIGNTQQVQGTAKDEFILSAPTAINDSYNLIYRTTQYIVLNGDFVNECVESLYIVSHSRLGRNEIDN